MVLGDLRFPESRILLTARKVIYFECVFCSGRVINCMRGILFHTSLIYFFRIFFGCRVYFLRSHVPLNDLSDNL